MGFLALFVRLVHVFRFPASVVAQGSVCFERDFFFEGLIRIRNFTRSQSLLVGFLV